jgi:hypothetical protein
MMERPSRKSFASRPGTAEAWIKAPDATPQSSAGDISGFTARLTIDITPALRGRIKVAACRRGITVANMLRDLLAREFPPTEGGHS